MDHIFTAVQDRISSTVPDVKWVDYDFGQLDNFSMRPPVLFPCVLIDIELPECSDMGQLQQSCKCNVTLRVAFEQPGQTNNKVSQRIKDNALAIFRILDQIHSSLHGFAGEGFNALLMRSILTEKREDPLKVLSVRFETSYITRKEKKWKEVIITPVITTD
jgi:hypothetical protein